MKKTPSNPVSAGAFLAPVLFILFGAVCLALALGLRLYFIEVEFRSFYAAAAFGVLGAGLLALGGRNTVRVLRPDRAASDDTAEIVARWKRNRPFGCMFLFVSLGILAVVIFDGSIGAVDILRGVWFFYIVAMFLLVGAVAVLWNPEAAHRMRKLRRGEGLRGLATVRTVRDSNITNNDDPVVRMDLLMELEGCPSYEVRDHAVVVPRIRVGLLKKEQVLPVIVDPESPETLLILWDEA